MSKGTARLLFAEEVNRVFKKSYEEVKRIRKITDLKQQLEEIREALRMLLYEWDNEISVFWRKYKEEGELGSWRDIDTEFTCLIDERRYEGEYSPYKLLLKLEQEANGKLPRKDSKNPNNRTPNEKPKCCLYSCKKELTGKHLYSKFCSVECHEKFNGKGISSSQQTQTTTTWHCANYNCPSGFVERTDSEYWYNTQKHDNKKFCSEECYVQEYGEYCRGCRKKCLTYYRDDSLIYCYDCWEEKNNNLEITIYCHYCGDKTNSILPSVNWCSKEECIQKERKKIRWCK